LHAGCHTPITDAIGRAKSRVGKAVVSRIDRIAAKPTLNAAETSDVAAILAAMTDRIEELTATVERLAAQNASPKPPAALPVAKPITLQPATKPASKPRQRRRIVLGRMTRQAAEERVLDTLKAANGHWPQGVRTLAKAAGTKRTTTASVLAAFIASGVIAKTAGGLMLLA
jgi:hypothetical protein